MKFKNPLFTLIVLILFISCSSKKEDDNKPNIVIIYADDIGYGDLEAN